MAAPQPEPVFNTFKRKLYRPFYSLLEFRIGIVCLVMLGAVCAWVVWRGAHPEPGLFRSDDRLLTAQATNYVVYKRPVEPWSEAGKATAPSLGPFPPEIVGDDWK